MKKVTALLIILAMLFSLAQAQTAHDILVEMTMSDIVMFSKSQLNILSVELSVALSVKAAKVSGNIPSRVLGMDLSSFSIEQLQTLSETVTEMLTSETKNSRETTDDLFALWQENGIYLDDLELRHSYPPDSIQDFYIYVYTIGEDFKITYRLHSDKEVVIVDIPWGYHPKDDMFAITISYILEMSLDDAKQLYDSLLYNMIDSVSEREIGNVSVVLSEIITPSLMITRTF